MTKPRLISNNKSQPPSDEQLVDAIAELLVTDALKPPRRLRLRYRPARPRQTPALRVVKGGRP